MKEKKGFANFMKEGKKSEKEIKKDVEKKIIENKRALKYLEDK